MAVALGGAALTGLTAGPARAAGIADVDAFVSRHNGGLVDYDGYPTDWPWQCFDLWVFYCREVVGFQNVLSTQYGGHPGYACAIWDGFDYNGSGSYFNKIDAGSAPQKGDVAVWQFGAYNHATSHVAVIIEDRGSNVLVFEQNGWPRPPLCGAADNQVGHRRVRPGPSSSVRAGWAPDIAFAQ